MEFDEIATSDGKTPIHFYVFKYNGELDGEFTTSEEIERFKWYSSNDGTDTVSSYLSTGSSAANLPASQILKKASDTSDYTDVRN